MGKEFDQQNAAHKRPDVEGIYQNDQNVKYSLHLFFTNSPKVPLFKFYNFDIISS
jgi:hypothetical protein